MVLVFSVSKTDGMRIRAGIPTIKCNMFSIIPASKVPDPNDTTPYRSKNTIPHILQSFIAEGVIFSRILRNITAMERKNIVAMNDAIVNNCGG